MDNEEVREFDSVLRADEDRDEEPEGDQVCVVVGVDDGLQVAVVDGGSPDSE